MCKKIPSSDGFICQTHGSAWTTEGCLMWTVLGTVAEHRQYQYETYGANRDVVDGTGPEVEWLKPVTQEVDAFHTGGFCLTGFTAKEIEDLFRGEWDYLNDGTEEEKAGYRKTASWMRMLREEVAEAFREDDPERLIEELTQIAALSVSWIEKIQEREIFQYGQRHPDGSVFTMSDWRCVADVIRDQHGLAPSGSQVRVVKRPMGGEWVDA
jgi:hypothetical protein